MEHSVRGTLLSLFAGVVAQRLLQLFAFVCIARSAGPEGLGLFAQGQALAAVLAVLAGAGVRNVAARAILRAPHAARAVLRLAIRRRLFAGVPLAAVAAAAAFLSGDRPLFWSLCALQVLPHAFDLKNLLDAAGRTRAEIVLETAAALLQATAVAIWATVGGGVDGAGLEVLAAIALGCRCVYAAGALAALRAVPGERRAAGAEPLLPARPTPIGFAQAAHELLAIGDVAVVGLVLGDAAAGLYAVAVRFAGAALLPSAQLARLLLPHLLRAARGGDPGRTFAVAARATLWTTLPMAAGGAVVAEPLCALGGAEFAAAAAALRLLLLAGCLQHVGWQASHTLLAAGRDGRYAATLGLPAGLHLFALGACALVPIGTPHSAAAWCAAAAVAAHAGYAAAAVGALGASRWGAAPLLGPLAAAAATAFAAWAGSLLPEPCTLPAQLAAGGIAFAAALWRVELRGRLHRVGDGLSAASGFHR